MAGALTAAKERLSGWPGGLVIGVTATLLALSLTPLVRHDDGAAEPSGELVIVSGQDDSNSEIRQKLIDEWNSRNPNNPARIIPLSSNADKQHSQMLAMAQAGDRVDIYNLDVTWVAEFASAPYIQPLTGVDTAGFLKKPLDTGFYQGQRWALPFNTDAGLLYFRTDLVEPHETPRYLPPDAAYARELLTPPRSPLTAAYAGQFADYEGLTVNALEAIWGAGGNVVDMVDKDLQVTIDSPETIEGLSRLADAFDPPGDARPYALGGQEADSIKAFTEGKVALMRNWPVQYNRIASPEPGNTSTGHVARHFDVAKLPTPSVLGGQDLAVAANSPHPQAARQLIEFLTSPASQARLFREGGFAPVREITYDPHVRNPPYAATLKAAVEAAQPRPMTPHYIQFSEAFRDIVRYALDHQGHPPPGTVRILANALKGQR